MANEKVKVQIKPWHAIGGVGEAGDVVWMSVEDAEMYFRDGYVEYYVEEQTSAVSGQQLAEGASSTPMSTSAPLSTKEEEHAVMKPEVKRGKRVVRKK